jgi:hypothetical protein
MDLFIVPTIGFDLLYGLVIVRLARRDLVWINVTPHPTAEWVARQITEAFPWNEAPRYLIRDRDQVYGARRFNRSRSRRAPTPTTLSPAIAIAWARGVLSSSVMIFVFSIIQSAFESCAAAGTGSIVFAAAYMPASAIEFETKFRRVSEAAVNPNGFDPQHRHMMTSLDVLIGPH